MPRPAKRVPAGLMQIVTEVDSFIQSASIHPSHSNLLQGRFVFPSHVFMQAPRKPNRISDTSQPKYVRLSRMPTSFIIITSGWITNPDAKPPTEEDLLSEQ